MIYLFTHLFPSLRTYIHKFYAIYIYICLHISSSPSLSVGPSAGEKGWEARKEEGIYIFKEREKDDVSRGGRGREKREGRDFKMTM